MSSKQNRKTLPACWHEAAEESVLVSVLFAVVLGVSMTCFHPLRGYELIGRETERGKALIVFSPNNIGQSRFKEVDIPCGQCKGCRISRSRDIAVRCCHEAELYDDNCFVTLTYNEENYPEGGSLVKSDFQKFMKRLRKQADNRIRYFMCGEYGDDGLRPHYHALLFNYDFCDKVLFSIGDNDNRVYRSKLLERLWPFGYSLIGSVTFESAAYVARYCQKKVNGKAAEDYYRRADEFTGELVQVVPEYSTSSRRPGIGKPWLDRFQGDIYPKDFCTISGKKYPAPKYYDIQVEKLDKDLIDRIKEKRALNEEKRVEVSGVKTLERLAAKERVLDSKLKRLVRSL